MAVKTPKNRLPESNGQHSGTTKVANVAIPAIKLASFKLKVVGISPLIVQRFSEKAQNQMKEKQEKKAKGPREARNPHQEYLDACYVMPGSKKAGEKGCRYGMPAAGLKHCAVKACRVIDDMPMTTAKMLFQVEDQGGGLVEIKFREMVMREDICRLKDIARTPMHRYRPEFRDWSCEFNVTYNASVMTPAQLVNMFNIGGFHIGLCELRPEKGYGNGMFKVSN